MGIPDYNAHWVNRSNCMFECPNLHQCTAKRPPTHTDIDSLLRILEIDAAYFVQSDHVWIDGEISQEDKSFLRHSLSFRVLARDTTLSPSEQQIFEAQ